MINLSSGGTLLSPHGSPDLADRSVGPTSEKMSDVGLLLWPKWKSAVNTGRKRNERLKAVFLVLLGLAFGLGIYYLSITS